MAKVEIFLPFRNQSSESEHRMKKQQCKQLRRLDSYPRPTTILWIRTTEKFRPEFQLYRWWCASNRMAKGARVVCYTNSKSDNSSMCSTKRSTYILTGKRLITMSSITSWPPIITFFVERRRAKPKPSCSSQTRSSRWWTFTSNVNLIESVTQWMSKQSTGISRPVDGTHSRTCTLFGFGLSLSTALPLPQQKRKLMKNLKKTPVCSLYFSSDFFLFLFSFIVLFNFVFVRVVVSVNVVLLKNFSL